MYVQVPPVDSEEEEEAQLRQLGDQDQDPSQVGAPEEVEAGPEDELLPGRIQGRPREGPQTVRPEGCSGQVAHARGEQVHEQVLHEQVQGRPPDFSHKEVGSSV